MYLTALMIRCTRIRRAERASPRRILPLVFGNSGIANNGTHFFLDHHGGVENSYRFDAYTTAGVRVSAFDITGLGYATGTYDYYGADVYGNTFYYAAGGDVKYVTAASTGVAYGAETAVATNITNDISSLADGSVTCVLPSGYGRELPEHADDNHLDERHRRADHLFGLLQRHYGFVGDVRAGVCRDRADGD